ncbi:MAG: hypothetical protein ACO3EZ_19890 [Prochlorotrichaceae cyanobacterium]
MAPIIKSVPGGGTSGIDYVSSTPPSSPSSGELWFKPTDNGFTGTSGLWIYKVVQADPLVAYWVTAHTKELYWNNGNSNLAYTLTNGAVFGQAVTANPSPYSPPFGYNNSIFVDSWTVRGYSSNPGTSVDASNKFDLHEGLSGASGIYITTVDSLDKVRSASPNFGRKIQYPINAVVSTAVNNALALNLYVQNVVGSPALVERLSWNYAIRGIHP